MSDREAKMTEKASIILAKKELKLLFKSKRRIFLLTITPLMILLIGVIAVGTATMLDDDIEPVQISVVNESQSNVTTQLLSLYDLIENTEINEVSQSYSDLLESKEFQVLVYFPSNFTDLVNNNQSAQLAITYNTNSSEYSQVAFEMFQLTNVYEQQLLVADNPEIEFDRLQPSINEVEVEETGGGLSEDIAASIFIIPVYIIFFVVIPPISLIMISVTQEREMQTLETLFLQPVPRTSIISGKIIYGMAIVGIVLVLDIIAALIDFLLINRLLKSEGAGTDLNLILKEFSEFIGADIIGYFLLTILLISTLIVGLAVLMSLIAKDEREANLISSALPLLMISIIFIVQFINLVDQPFSMQILLSVIPLMGILVALYILLVSGTIGLVAISSALAQIFWIIVVIGFAARLSESESILELSGKTLLEELKKMVLFRK